MFQSKLNLLILFLAIGLDVIRAQDVVFGNHEEPSGETCSTKQGGPGRCVEFRECPGIRKTFLTDPPTTCGFRGATPIICCPVKSEPLNSSPDTSVSLLDISSPNFSSDFKCGQRAIKRTESVGPSRFRRSIVGGVISERNAWPWMALLGTRENGSEVINWFCGGVLINDQWVLTAAHCLNFLVPQVIRLGEHDYLDPQDGANHQDFSILEMINHPKYKYPGASYDLALIQLSKKVKFQSYISPICLPWGDASNRDLTGEVVTATGWGDTEFAGSPSSVLQQVQLTIFPISKCQENYSQLRQFSQLWPSGMGAETICAGDVDGGRDACQGDSGGPIVYNVGTNKYVLSGIVSTGYGCGAKDFPGIFANVQYPTHLAWIKATAF